MVVRCSCASAAHMSIYPNTQRWHPHHLHLYPAIIMWKSYRRGFQVRFRVNNISQKKRREKVKRGKTKINVATTNTVLNQKK